MITRSDVKKEFDFETHWGENSRKMRAERAVKLFKNALKPSRSKQSPEDMGFTIIHNCPRDARYAIVKYLVQNFVSLERDLGRRVVCNMIDTSIFGSVSSGDRVFSEKKDKCEKENGYYEYIPASRGEFIKALRKLKDRFNLNSFIDIGSGIGDKTILAHLLGFKESYGVEYNNHTYELSQYFKVRLIPMQSDEEMFPEENEENYPIKFFHEDAFKLDYSYYDLIYTFCPISGRMMSRLWAKIMKEMKINSILFEIWADGGIRSTFYNSFLDINKPNFEDYFEEVNVGGNYYAQRAFQKIKPLPNQYLV